MAAAIEKHKRINDHFANLVFIYLFYVRILCHVPLRENQFCSVARYVHQFAGAICQEAVKVARSP